MGGPREPLVLLPRFGTSLVLARFAMRRIAWAAIPVALVLLAACGHSGGVRPGYSAAPAPPPAAGAVPWPLPSNPMALVRQAGLTPGTHEFFTYHVHAHLDAFVNGRHVQIPGGIGIDLTDPGVHRGDTDGGPSYGYIKLCPRPCISPLHTHDVTGVLHIEAPTRTRFTLGQFFQQWGVWLDGSCVGGYCEPGASVVVFVDGKRHRGNPAGIALAARQELALVIGSPPSSIPSTYAFPSGG
jgi:hypothetical protein